MSSELSGQSDTEDVTLRVCDCGVIAAGYAMARCGREGRRNLSARCPTRLMRVVAWEEVPEHAEARYGE